MFTNFFTQCRHRHVMLSILMVQKAPKINWLLYQLPLVYRKTFVNFVNPIHVTTYAESPVNIGPAIAEIHVFGGIC